MKRNKILIGLFILMMVTACGEKSENVETEVKTEIGSEVETNEEDEMNVETESKSEEIETEEIETEEIERESGIDVDLTSLSATMVYAEVYNMYMYPEEYVGQVVKMQGAFSFLEIEETDMIYFSVIIEDALGCCAQGIEFELAGDYVYPDDYPTVGDEVTVVGTFEIYYEYDVMYCRLQNAVFQ
ncbi:MAG: hypothetical protein R3Y58_09965 [Eubacteriales bacterium]